MIRIEKPEIQFPIKKIKTIGDEIEIQRYFCACLNSKTIQLKRGENGQGTSNGSIQNKTAGILCHHPGVGLICGTATGQDAKEDNEFLMEEIVVTAEFRQKEIQDTPLSITAVNAETIEARNQVSIEQIAV